MSIKERLQAYCKAKHTRVGTFCLTAGISSSYFYQVKNGVGSEIQKKIEEFYPDLNVEWLRTGEGEMLVSDEPEATIKPHDGEGAVPINSLQVNIDTGEVEPKEVEPIPSSAKVIAVVPRQIAREGSVDVKEYVEHNASELRHIDPLKLLDGSELAEEITGTAMYPTFLPNDKVFVKCFPVDWIIDGKMYYFNIKNKPTMIRFVKVLADNKLRLIALNQNFGDIIIDTDDVLRVGLVVGMFRNTFGDQYAELEALRRKKDEQINKLLDQNGIALNIIQGFIQDNK